MIDQEFTIGQAVEILVGKHQGVRGQIVAHEWTEEAKAWHYFVMKRDEEFGP